MTRLLLEWVVTASLLILAVMALRALLGKRISAGLKYALWAVVLLRLLVPLQFFSLPVPEMLPEAGQAPISVSAAPAPTIQGEPVGVPAIAAPVPSGVAVNHAPTLGPTAVTRNAVRLENVLCWLWLAGALIMAAAFLISNLTFALRLRRVRTPLEGADCPLPVYIADGLPSPCLFGLFRPAVYVTAETAQDPAMLRHILAHEHTHFRHGDHVWNVLRSAALAVHWWNPLVWLAVVLIHWDCELACDEGALKRLGDGERIAYGRTLLALITVKPRPGDLLRCATTMTAGQKNVFDRVTRIAKAPKRWLWAAVAAVAATALACVCAFGQADKPDTPPATGVAADLTFSLETNSDGGTYVRMDGTVDGVELPRGAFWEPPWRGMMTKKFPYGRVSMVYPPFTDGIEGQLTAGWLDESHTKVVLSTDTMAYLSSYAPSGWWEFTVDLEQGEIILMESPTLKDAVADEKVRMYPESISEEDALKAARIAAKLLTEGENYYNSAAGLFGLTADLTFSLSPANLQTVYIQGTVGEFTVYDGTTWSPVSAYDLDPLGNIFIPYPPFGEEHGMAAVWWVDESRTAVTVTGQPLAIVSSGSGYTGWRTFTVSFGGDGGTITESHVHGSGDNIYLASLSDEETVNLARFAAKLLTAAEDYYGNCSGGADIPQPYADVLEGGQFYGVYLDQWTATTLDRLLREEKEAGYMPSGAEASAYALADLDGDETDELILFVAQEGVGETYLIFHQLNEKLCGYLGTYKSMQSLKADGTFFDQYLFSEEWNRQGLGYSRVSFTETGLEFHPFTYSLSLGGDLPDEEKYVYVVDGKTVDYETYSAAVQTQDAKPGVKWYALPLKDLDDAPAQSAAPVIDLSACTFTMDEYGVSVDIAGLDCQYARWRASRTDHNNGGMTEPSLSISEPRFLGYAFSGVYSSVEAEFQDGQLRMHVTEDIENSLGTLGIRDFLVDLTTGVVTEQENNHLIWSGKLPVPPDKVLANAALTLAQLGQAASSFYQSALPAPEEGPLPFDVPMKLMFASGAGAWDTLLTLHPDGSFEGDYSDTNMGDSGAGYPYGNEYVCQFHGRFRDVVQVTDASWSLVLDELVLDTGRPVSEEWIEEGVQYISWTPYGFDKKGSEGTLEPGAKFMLYSPEARGYAPGDELYGMTYREDGNYDSVMGQFWTWQPWNHRVGRWGRDTVLGYWGLCNMETGQGFFDLKAWGIA